MKIVVLHHEKSKNYTESFLRQVPSAIVYDSSERGTQFTESFNNALDMIGDDDWIMVANNDIDIDQNKVLELDTFLSEQFPGIFSPQVNSPHRGVMDKIGDAEKRCVPWVEFVCPIIHRDIIKHIGYLDDNLTLGYGVELDYCYRAKQQNYLTFLIQNISIYHHGHKSQDNHSLYTQKAGGEMHQVLSKKYSDNWNQILEFPQWS